jgi:hypothetical protein
VVTTAIGVYMVKTLIDMIKKKQQAYKETIIITKKLVPQVYNFSY